MSKSKAALGVVFLVVFIDLIGFGIVIPLSPYLARKYAASPFEVGLLMSIFSLAQFIFSPVWGRISDRIGRRPILLMGLLGSGLSYLGFAFATTLTGLFIARLFAGIFGATISTASAYIADVTDKSERSKGMGLIGAAFGLGFVLGPFIGGFAGSWGKSLGAEAPYGMSFAAIVAAGICLSNFVLACFVLKESLTPEMRKIAGPRASRFMRLKEHIGKPVLGHVLMVLFLATLAMAHMESILFLLMKDRFDWSVEMSSFGFAYIGIMIAFTQGYLARKLLPKWGERKLLSTGLILASIGMYGIGFSSSIAMLAMIMTVLTIGYGVTSPAVMGSISLLSSADEQGEVMGVGQSLSALGRILGPAMGGWLYGNVSHESPFLAAGGFMSLALILIIVNRAKLPDSAKK